MSTLLHQQLKRRERKQRLPEFVAALKHINYNFNKLHENKLPQDELFLHLVTLYDRPLIRQLRLNEHFYDTNVIGHHSTLERYKKSRSETCDLTIYPKFRVQV